MLYVWNFYRYFFGTRQNSNSILFIIIIVSVRAQFINYSKSAFLYRARYSNIPDSGSGSNIIIIINSISEYNIAIHVLIIVKFMALVVIVFLIKLIIQRQPKLYHSLEAKNYRSRLITEQAQISENILYSLVLRVKLIRVFFCLFISLFSVLNSGLNGYFWIQ